MAKTTKTENIQTEETKQEKPLTMDYYFTAHVNFSGKMYNAGQKYGLTTEQAINLRKFIIDKKDQECISCKSQK